MSKRSKQHRQGKATQPRVVFELSSYTKAQLEAAAKSRAAAQRGLNNAFAAKRAAEERTKKQTKALMALPARVRKDGTGTIVRRTENVVAARTIAKAERHATKPLSNAELAKQAHAIVARRNVASPLMPEAPGFPGVPSGLPLLMGATFSDADNAALRADLWTLLTATLPNPTRTRCERTADDGHICGMPAVGRGNHGLNTCQMHDREARLALVMARIQRRPADQ
jgi:hypothetical protein